MTTKIICFASSKGGSGKTVTAASLARLLSYFKRKVLLVDADAATNGLTLLFLNELVEYKEKLNEDEYRKLNGIFDHPIWKQFASKCIGCGICTYSCPTCYCFDMQDEASFKKGRRVRTWDSCMFAEYTLHASGHNPRQNKNDRLKNRIYHKFKFNVDNFGKFSCVGCGRCITLCPVNVDLIENLSAIKELE